jgi:hypothetical protein
MTSRQAPRERPAAERKAKKHLLKQSRLNATAPPTPVPPPPCDDEEFTPPAKATTHERALHKALSTLLKMQKDRRTAELTAARGFVSQSAEASHSQSQKPPPQPTARTPFASHRPDILRT